MSVYYRYCGEYIEEAIIPLFPESTTDMDKLIKDLNDFGYSSLFKTINEEKAIFDNESRVRLNSVKLEEIINIFNNNGYRVNGFTVVRMAEYDDLFKFTYDGVYVQRYRGKITWE